jgi:hypothetical protein
MTSWSVRAVPELPSPLPLSLELALPLPLPLPFRSAAAASELGPGIPDIVSAALRGEAMFNSNACNGYWVPDIVEW